MKTIREEMEKQQKKQIQTIEEAKNAHIKRVMEKNQKDFMEIRVYYSEIKKRENDDAKRMFDLEQRNKQLKEPLKRANQDVERLENELVAYEEDKKKLATV